MVILTRDDFYLLTHINDLIARFVEHGLIVKWMEKRHSLRMSNNDTPPELLTVEHLLGAFILLGVGQLLGALSFIMEYSLPLLKRLYQKYNISKRKQRPQLKMIYRRPKNYPKDEY